ncbi:TPA: hypothetical protein ACVY19_006326 [Klebsiella michiganensis]
MSKSKTKAEKLHLSRVAALGCIVCRNLDYGESPAEMHSGKFITREGI